MTVTGIGHQATPPRLVPSSSSTSSELEGTAELSGAEGWQRAQALATWDRIKAGDLREASVEELRELVDRVRERLKRSGQS